MSNQLHPIQASVLYSLRHAKELRFSKLMRPSGLTSDDFKFHLRSLAKQNLVTKTDNGQYCLTRAGKEFANSLDHKTLQPRKQPKLSVIIMTQNSDRKLLCHQRNRNPYLYFWGFISGPVWWGEDIEEAARRELHKQTDLTADFTVVTFLRQRDYLSSAEQPLEDKLFVIVQANNPKGELLNTWHGGINQWMSAEEFKKQPRVFTTSLKAISLTSDLPPYTEVDTIYDANDY
jgi:predicted transcriptional regulator